MIDLIFGTALIYGLVVAGKKRAEERRAAAQGRAAGRTRTVTSKRRKAKL